MSEWNFIIAAYALTWLVLAGYLVYLNERVRRARLAWREASGAPEVGP